MPYVKPTVHLSRLAGTALKSFTHGYAQTVVAASQSSYAAQNTPPGPLADTLIAKFRKSEKSRLQSAYHHYADSSRQASTATATTGRFDSSHADAGLDKYFDAWQKHQHNGSAKEWQQFQFAKRIEWQPPTTVPTQTQEASAAEQPSQYDEKLSAPSLKRSYTTSALDNFEKAINDVAAEAIALEQVNNAIAEEIERLKEDAEDGLMLKTTSASATSQDASLPSDRENLSSPATSFTHTESFTGTAEIDPYTESLVQLHQSQQYGEIPIIFQAMLRAGVQQPSPAAYGALLSSAIALTHDKHLKVPKALEVYSDMLRRKVTPDSSTFSTLVNLLAKRSSESIALRKGLEERLARYGGLDEAGSFMFRSSQSEHTMLLEDSSLSIALKLFDRAAQVNAGKLSSESCAALVIACAEQSRLDDMVRIFQYMEDASMAPQSAVYPSMITAFGASGDLRSAVEMYDQYKELAIAHNAGKNEIARIDNDVYAAMIKAYGSVDRLKGGLKFLASIQRGIADGTELSEMREAVALQALLPLALNEKTFDSAFELANSLSGRANSSALAAICATAADRNLATISLEAFELLSKTSHDLVSPATAMLAMHVRNAGVENAEPYWRILESATASLSLLDPTTMRAIALVGMGQSDRAIRQSRRMFSRIRDQQPESAMVETAEHIDEAIELIGSFMLKSHATVQPEASVELLRMMTENGGLVAPIAEHIVARFGPEHISRLNAADTELLLRIQAGMIMNESSADIAGPARFGCLLEGIVSRAIMPSTETENIIERTLINIDRAELSRLWNSYRYPQTPAFTPVLPFQQAHFVQPVQPTFDDSFDPYASRTDVKGSNGINELLERPQGRRTNEAMTKFRNMRRVGRVPRMFTYGKLIEGAAKENNLNMAHEVLEMARKDVPYDARYRVIRFGWQQILDHMVAACLTVNRRDLAARYHQELLDMGAAPSANTFGLYITTLKETTKTFDEASEAVKIFLRAKAEGVEPSSFLYNALIGKLGKARRIDDCLFYFAEMRNLGIRPTSVTYGTVVNALCRVSDEKFAEEIFEEMEAATNYKPRPAPYHSLMQFFLTTRRDRNKVLGYYERMVSKGIEPTVHTFKLLIDTHATLEPIDMPGAEAVLDSMRVSKIEPEAVHYASLIHAKGCVLHDLEGARKLFDFVAASGIRMQPCLYQAMFESLNANHEPLASPALLADMERRGVEFTPYIANALIHGWTLEKDLTKAKQAFARVPMSKREPSTYESMVRACLAVADRDAAKAVVREALSRGYPNAVASKIAELVR
ncbi:Hypothetical protein R9X50_00760900 [Acrodontium crateriforme]|uniref:Tetratricopeptide repeat domain-containing protein n=1 Tax=Acrodontium crateriforme TaxID=150365 RepID=A0AAQ3R7V5_9PEZI|nr:Hypothetical protein R9X50_00760900 [Acrodontium crateriforme]